MAATRIKGRRNRSIRLRMLVGAFCCLGAAASWANEPSQTDATIEAISEKEDANWLLKQIRRFRSHPHLDRAYRLQKAGRLDEARAEIARALDVDPGNEQARIEYLLLLENLEDSDAVIAHASKLLQVPERRTYALLARARAYRSLGRYEEARADLHRVAINTAVTRQDRDYAARTLADIELRAGRYDEALKALALLPDTADYEVLFRRGIANEALQRYEEAASLYTAALRLAKESGERLRAHQHLGHNAVKRQDWETAHSHFDAALALDPGNVALMRALVHAAHRAGHARQALRWAGEVMARDPTPEDKEVLANLRFGTDDYPGAVREYEQLLAQVDGPADRARILAGIGYSYFEMERYADAEKAFQASLRLRQDTSTRNALAVTRDILHPPEPPPVVAQPDPTTAEGLLGLSAAALERGEEAQAIEYLEQVTRFNKARRQRETAYRRLWPLYYARGQQDAARDALEQLLTLAPRDAAAHRALAHIQLEQGDESAAVVHFEHAATLAPSGESYSTLAYAQTLLGDWQGAIATNRRLLELPGLAETERAEAYERLARAYVELGDYAQAEYSLAEALLLGVDNPLIRERYGLVLFTQQQWQAALIQFRALYERQASPMAALYLARCYAALKKTGLAVHYGRLAQEQAGELPPGEDTQLLAELAYLYAEESEHASAANMWAQVIARQPTPLATYNYAVAQHAAGNVDEALRAWKSIPDGSLPQEAEVGRLHGLGLIHSNLGKLDEAISYYERAEALKPSAERQYRIAMAHLTAGRHAAATPFFEQAYARDANAEHAISLGYAYIHAKRYGDGARVLEEALRLAPDRIELYQDIAYAHLHDYATERAVEWFKRGIDARLAQQRQLEATKQQDSPTPPAGGRSGQEDAGKQPPDGEDVQRFRSSRLDWRGDEFGVSKALALHANFKQVSLRAPRQDDGDAAPSQWFRRTGLERADPQQAAKLPFGKTTPLQLSQSVQGVTTPPVDPEIERMRDEVARLDRTWSFTLYQAYSPAQDRATIGVGSSGGSVIPSQGGIEIAYRPPAIGFRDERIFDAYVRTLWANRARTLDIREESLQGGIGVRYKPFRSAQFYISGERLFKIGSEAQNEWLLRLSYGWTDIADTRLGEEDWNYSLFYADAGYFTDDDHTRAFYAEARQGRTFRVGERWRITPHLVVNGRYEQPNFSPGSYMQAGAGASVKYLFRASRYASYRSSLEFLVQYKVGVSHVASGWLLTLVARI